MLGSVWGGLVVATSVVLFLNLLALYRFNAWLNSGQHGSPPEMPGAWGAAGRQVALLHGRGRQHRRRLSAAVTELKKVTRALPDGAVVLNSLFEIQRTNDAAARLAGIRGDDRGRRIDTLLRQPEFTSALAHGDWDRSIEIPSPQRDGVTLALRIVSLGRDELLLLIRDVTAERAAQRARRDFVANASHELRTPLTVISGYLDTMETDDTLRKDWSGPLSQMQLQTRRMRQIITDLLELSRLDAAGPADNRPVDVGGLMTLIREEALSLSDQPPDISLEVTSATRLLGAEAEIHSAFSNLVANAVRYTPAGKAIRLRWSVDDEGGHFEVLDEGIGIEAEYIPRLTERFFRVEADRGRPREGGGTGLGLAIVKHTLQRHDAHLSIDSTPGVGSRFACHFPVERLEADT